MLVELSCKVVMRDASDLCLFCPSALLALRPPHSFLAPPRVGFGGKASTLCSNVPRAGIRSGPGGCASPTSNALTPFLNEVPISSTKCRRRCRPRNLVSLSSPLFPKRLVPKGLLRRLLVAAHPNPAPTSPQATLWPFKQSVHREPALLQHLFSSKLAFLHTLKFPGDLNSVQFSFAAPRACDGRK